MDTNTDKINALEETLSHIYRVLERIKECTGVESRQLANFLDVTLCREIEILHKIVNNKWTKDDYEEYKRITQNYINTSNGMGLNAIRTEIEKLYKK